MRKPNGFDTASRRRRRRSHTAGSATPRAGHRSAGRCCSPCRRHAPASRDRPALPKQRSPPRRATSIRASAGPAADPPAPDPTSVRLRPPSEASVFCRVRPVPPLSQPIDPERAATGQFAHRAKAFQPVEQSGRRPAREIAAGRRGRHGVLIEQGLDHHAGAFRPDLWRGGAQCLGAASNLAGGAQGRARPLDEGKADGAGKGGFSRPHAALPPSVLKAGP